MTLPLPRLLFTVRASCVHPGSAGVGVRSSERERAATGLGEGTGKIGGRGDGTEGRGRGCAAADQGDGGRSRRVNARAGDGEAGDLEGSVAGSVIDHVGHGRGRHAGGAAIDLHNRRACVAGTAIGHGHGGDSGAGWGEQRLADGDGLVVAVDHHAAGADEGASDGEEIGLGAVGAQGAAIEVNETAAADHPGGRDRAAVEVEDAGVGGGSVVAEVDGRVIGGGNRTVAGNRDDAGVRAVRVPVSGDAAAAIGEISAGDVQHRVLGRAPAAHGDPSGHIDRAGGDIDETAEAATGLVAAAPRTDVGIAIDRERAAIDFECTVGTGRQAEMQEGGRGRAGGLRQAADRVGRSSQGDGVPVERARVRQQCTDSRISDHQVPAGGDRAGQLQPATAHGGRSGVGVVSGKLDRTGAGFDQGTRAVVGVHDGAGEGEGFACGDIHRGATEEGDVGGADDRVFRDRELAGGGPAEAPRAPGGKGTACQRAAVQRDKPDIDVSAGVGCGQCRPRGW